MKLKHKIYLFQLLFTTILLSFMFFTYNSYETQYNKDLTEYVKEKTNTYKQQFVDSYNEAFYKFDKRKKLFKSIHHRTLKLLKENPHINLSLLKKRLHREFDLQDISLNIYLIDKKYIIYKTTFKKDIGFDLSIIREAKEFLDKTSIDKKIHIADLVSTDALSMEYKLYSYSYLSENNYLELGFIDKSIDNNFKMIIEKNLKYSKKVQLFSITQTNNGYVYYPFLQTTALSKTDFFKQSKQYSLDDKILSSYMHNKQLIQYKDNFAHVITPIFEENVYKKIGYNNIILKVKIDISSRLEALKRYKTIFYISILITLVFLSIIYIFINKYFTYPIEKILESIKAKKEVEDIVILKKNDELSVIAKKYNMLLKSLNKEIKSNRTLLEENKRFIADTVHQIRTPLTNIMMNSEMIKRNDKNDTSSNFIDQINASINMLTNSYEDLSYTISYDTIEYKPTKLSISKILAQRVKFFSTLSKVNFKEISVNIEENIFVNMNQIEIERLIDNNISNGIKYADANNIISINLSKTNDKITLEFKTYGKAIKNPKKLFDKNYREDESKRGLGLGLNMVKGICEKYSIDYKIDYANKQNIFTYILKF